MAGMDHSQMNTARHNKPAQDHEAMGHGTTLPQDNLPAESKKTGMDHGAMGHGTTPAPVNAPAAGHQADKGHGDMPAAGNHQQAQHPAVKTDRYGRLLIDPSEPYDNNPAREQSPPRPKE